MVRRLPYLDQETSLWLLTTTDATVAHDTKRVERHPLSAKRVIGLSIGTWNVRTLVL